MPPLQLVGVLWLTCTLQNVCLEESLRYDSRSGQLISFCQYLFVPLTVLLTQWHRLQQRIFPWYLIAFTTIMTLLINKGNNTALELGVSLAVSTLYRSFSVVMSMCCGFLWYGKTFSRQEIAAACMVTLGLILNTIYDPKFILNCEGRADCFWTSSEPAHNQWLLGLSLLLLSLIATGFLGQWQEYLYKTYRTAQNEPPYYETMFYIHLIAGVLMSLMEGPQYVTQLISWSAHDQKVLGYIPYLYVLLGTNICLHFVCTKSVYTLSAQTTNVMLNIVLTTRKAWTILWSTFWYGNQFTRMQWFGTFLVFLGAYLYTPASKRKKA